VAEAAAGAVEAAAAAAAAAAAGATERIGGVICGPPTKSIRKGGMPSGRVIIAAKRAI